MKMNDQILAILAKWSKDGGDLPPGEYKVDETIALRLQGIIKVSGMVEYTPTIKMPLLTVMAVLLHRMGFQRDRAAELLSSAMLEALSIGEKASGPIGDIVDDINGAMERVRSITAALPKETRRGPTRIEKMRVEIIREDDRLAS
jgi:hypothetical protein